MFTASVAFAQEQSASGKPSPDEALWQKQCLDEANGDKLVENLRPTFMIECVAGAKLSTQQKP